MNKVTGMTATNIAVDSGSEANNGPVVLKNAGGRGEATNAFGSGIVIDDVKIPLSGLSSQNANVTVGGRTSNKKFIIFK